MSKKINIDQLAATLQKELAEYTVTVTDEVKETVKDIGKYAARQIAQKSPRRAGGYPKKRERVPGTYAKGWKSKVAFEGRNDIRVVVYNKDGYMTHLLENGHKKVLWGRVTGGRVPAKLHIKPVEDEINQKLPKEIKVKIR